VEAKPTKLIEDGAGGDAKMLVKGYKISQGE
jgi:hypothetical protein